MFKRAILIIVFLFPVSLFSIDFDGKTILKVNGHEHKIDDIFSKEFSRYYEIMRPTIQNEIKGKKFGGNKILELRLKEKINRIEFFGNSNGAVLRMKINNNRAKVKTKFLGISITIWVKLDLYLEVDTKRVIDELGIQLEVEDTYFIADDIEADQSWTIDWLLDFGIWIEDMVSVSGNFDEYVGKRFKMLPISIFNDLAKNGIVTGVDPEDEAQAVIESVPFDITFSQTDPPPTGLLGVIFNKQSLILEIDLLPGIYESGSLNRIYNNPIYEPDPVTNPSISWGGFSYNGINKYRFTQHWNPDPYTDPLENWKYRVDLTFQDIAAMGQNFSQMRIDAVWNEIAPPITSIDPNLNHNNISSTDVEDYMNLECDWSKLDYLLDKAEYYGLNAPYVIVGSGHKDRPLYFNDGANNLPIAPGTQVRGADPGNYKLVPENVYLYYLKLYTRAVVRYCKNNYYINVFQAENELNAARFAETYDWWRKGDAWASDAFQNNVAQILYQSIKDEFTNPEQVKVIQDFHIFNLA